MKEYIIKRVIDIAEYIVLSKSTVREAAAVFGVSKSTVHKDCTERLRQIDRALLEQVKQVLDLNLAQRHIRGGEATRKKYSAVSR